MRFLRYLCFYCASHLVYDAARAGFRKHWQQPKAACQHHVSGALLSLLAIIPVSQAPATAGAIFLPPSASAQRCSGIGWPFGITP
jgi:hypothetical protein